MTAHCDEPRKARRRPQVGPQVRQLRTGRGLTLTQLSEQTGLNVGYLSQVETDKASPSLETLAAIADALDVPITWLLVPTGRPPRVVRHDERRVWAGPNGVRGEEVDGGYGRTLRIIEVVNPPGRRTPLHTDPGEEHHLVLSGRVRLRQGEHAVELGPGDYLVWDGGVPHEAENIGDEPARVLIVTSGTGATPFPGQPEPTCVETEPA
ncbi:MAG TPA: XRE family transcriptional regulator [Thermomicrobiales bacterium]|nr:XRE family transcriptional regulator [Thermomicrobiales bacterium]